MRAELPGGLGATSASSRAAGEPARPPPPRRPGRLGGRAGSRPPANRRRADRGACAPRSRVRIWRSASAPRQAGTRPSPPPLRGTLSRRRAPPPAAAAAARVNDGRGEQGQDRGHRGLHRQTSARPAYTPPRRAPPAGRPPRAPREPRRGRPTSTSSPPICSGREHPVHPGTRYRRPGQRQPTSLAASDRRSVGDTHELTRGHGAHLASGQNKRPGHPGSDITSSVSQTHLAGQPATPRVDWR